MEKYNNQNIVEKHWIKFTIYSDRKIWTIWTKIFSILSWKWENLWFDYLNDIEKINNNLNLYDLNLWQYILESEDKEYLHSLKENLELNWTEVFWEFEYWWKYYLILHRAKKDWEILINEEIEKVEKGVWNIVDNK